MPGLNAMFNCMSNAMFNNTVFSPGTIPAMNEPVMHESMNRLYEAAKLLRKKEGQSEVARLLEESPQTLNNWEARGISRQGAIKAQALIGCDATWVLSGDGLMVSGAREPEEQALLAAYRQLRPEARAAVLRAAGVVGSIADDVLAGKVIDFQTDVARPAARKTGNGKP